MHPTVRILSIGDELVLGRVTDTNATFLCRLATDHGFRVLGAQQLGDGEAAIVAALRHAAEDADLILVSGGLGPTDDDRTRHALAAAMGVPLLDHPPSWAVIVARYRRLAPDREIPANNRRQALLPKGARPLANDRGTAPGMVAGLRLPTGKKSLVAVFPGVPHEMKAMATRFASGLSKRFPGLTVPTIGEVWFAGIGESAAQQRLGTLLSETAPHPQVGITVSELGHITVRVVGSARAVAARVRAVRACLREFLLPEPGLAPSLVAALQKSKATISAAESCTGGHVAALLTAVPGASKVLRESLITYHAAVKRARLGIPATILDQGVVSEECARAMAIGVREHCQASIGIATTGFAGPDGGTAEAPVGTVWLAVATARGCITRKTFVQGTRERIQMRAASAALQLTWDYLRTNVLSG
jgi:nicotinamide-nucleotide amidase